MIAVTYVRAEASQTPGVKPALDNGINTSYEATFSGIHIFKENCIKQNLTLSTLLCIRIITNLFFKVV